MNSDNSIYGLDFFEEIRAFASNPRCTNFLAVAQVMAAVASHEDGWRAINYDGFSVCLPGFGVDEYLDTVERSLDDEENFHAKDFFVEIDLLPSPAEAAICMALFVHDLGRTGEDEMLALLDSAFRAKLAEVL